MLDEGIRAAILELRNKCIGVRTIARMMKLSRGAVRGVVRAGSAAVPRLERREKAEPHEADIRELYQRCKGNLVRVHEELLLGGATLSYQALTGYCRRHGIGFTPTKPAGRYVFEPGEEMQHDTSPHVMNIGGVEHRVQTASVVLAYSRMRFMQVYPSFNRFTCKVFLDEAVAFFGGAARRCMVDCCEARWLMAERSDWLMGTSPSVREAAHADDGSRSEFGIGLGDRAETVASSIGARDVEGVAAERAFQSNDVHMDGVGQTGLHGRLGDFANEVVRLELGVRSHERASDQTER